MKGTEEMSTVFISTENFAQAVRAMGQEGDLYAPAEQEGHVHFAKIDSEKWDPACLGLGRAVDPIKIFFFQKRERVATYPGSESVEMPHKPIYVLGAKSCDVESLEILDKVFAEGDFKDPFYIRNRENTFIVSVDCAEASVGANCFCSLMDIKTWPEIGFDLNLSPIADGFVVQIGSPKGRALCEKYREWFTDLTPSQKQERQSKRAVTAKKVEEINKQFQLSESAEDIVKATVKGISDEEWAALGLEDNCVECGACTLICPTCHCFLLYDQVKDAGKGEYERMKVWDTCIRAAYSRMAGGGTPQPTIMKRLQNRLSHKFDYFVENFGMKACVGCGRCIEACMGGRDIRDLLKQLEAKVTAKA